MQIITRWRLLYLDDRNTFNFAFFIKERNNSNPPPPKNLEGMV